MSAKVCGPVSWNLDLDPKIEQPEFEKKYGEVLTELAKFVGAACNVQDYEAFSFLMHYVTLIFQGGYQVLKETLDEKKSKTFQEFLKKMNISKN